MPPGMPPRADADFGTEDAVAAQVARINAEAGVPDTGAPPPPEPEAEPAKKGGLFGKLMGKRGQPAPPPSDMAPPPHEDAGFGAPEDRGFGAPASGSLPTSGDASFDAGFPDEGVQDPALADPDLVAAAFGESMSKQKKARKGLPIVAIGWGILGLIVAVVVGLFAFAPATTMSVLPGASRLYAMLGMPVGAEGLAFEGVRYGWTTDGGQTVLEVQGNVRNTSSAAMAVPTVVIALRDENGDEISEWTTEVGAAELAAGEEAPFLRQIPSPPSNVRSLKVRFADADK
jgi:hypothetical protein